MRLEVFWGSGSPFAWSVLLACEYKKQPYQSHLLQFSTKEHKSPEMLRMNPRGKVPVLKDGDFTVYESMAILYYLERKFPRPALFGESAEEGAHIMQIVSEFQNYLAKTMVNAVRPFLFGETDKDEQIRECAAKTREELPYWEKLAGKNAWLAGKNFSVADLIVFPSLQLFLRGCGKEAAAAFDLGFLPFNEKYPQLAKWAKKIEAFPFYEKTYPPHWRS